MQIKMICGRIRLRQNRIRFSCFAANCLAINLWPDLATFLQCPRLQRGPVAIDHLQSLLMLNFEMRVDCTHSL